MIYQIVTGRIGRDASINEVNGRKAINFAVADNQTFKDQSGTEVQKTTWVNCTMWRDQGQSVKVKEHLTAGTLVAVHGEPSVRTYKNAENVVVAAMDLNVHKLELLSSPKEKE